MLIDYAIDFLNDGVQEDRLVAMGWHDKHTLE